MNIIFENLVNCNTITNDMAKNLSEHRKFYGKKMLSEKDLLDSPLELFQKWFDEVEEATGIEEANAMTVCTIGNDGFPKGRVVLLKYFDENGFTFFTNYNSEKGKSIISNPNVSLSFFWPNLERQVIVKGIASKSAEELSDSYFNSRPRMSRLGALVSNQSSPIESRVIIEEKLKQLKEDFEGKDIPRPKYWGGFTIKPLSVEFWQGRESRLHDRILYSLKEHSWKTTRLQP